MSTILFISGFSADRRAWADIPELVASDFAAEFYEQKSSVSYISDIDLAGAAELVPGSGRFAAVVSSGNGSSTAVALALRGLAEALLLIEPVPDSLGGQLPPSELPGPEEQMERYFALVSAARQETDEETWRQLTLDLVRGTFTEALGRRDRELLEAIAVDHAGEARELIREGVAATTEGRQWPPPPPPEAERWVERLSDVTVPVAIMYDERQSRKATFLAARAPHGKAVIGNTPGSPVWLTNRQQTVRVLTSLQA